MLFWLAAQARKPKIVNGPEIFDRYVGSSEERIRMLFADAEKEYQDVGDASQLHVIIFDEIDAICKQRGTATGSTGVNDSVVNQLLSKIDGVDALNNVLIIGALCVLVGLLGCWVVGLLGCWAVVVVVVVVVVVMCVGWLGWLGCWAVALLWLDCAA